MDRPRTIDVAGRVPVTLWLKPAHARVMLQAAEAAGRRTGARGMVSDHILLVAGDRIPDMEMGGDPKAALDASNSSSGGPQRPS